VKVDVKSGFGRVIKQLRLNAGLSQQELADYADIDRTYISDLERGLYYPSLEVIYKMCDVLNIKPFEVLEMVDKLLSKKG